LRDQQRDVVIVFWACVFCLFGARVPEFDPQPLPPTAVDVLTLYIPKKLYTLEGKPPSVFVRLVVGEG
jgi:hypothetical protein